MSSLGLDPNYLGCILAVAVIAFLTLARLDRSALPLVLCAPIVGGMIQAQSRGATVALSAGVVALVSLAVDRRTGFKVLFATGCFLVTAIGLGVSIGFGPFTERRLDPGSSGDARSEIVRANIKSVESEPLTGVGLGVGTSEVESRIGFAAVAHNEYLRFASETGLPGLLGVFALFGVPLFAGIVWPERRAAPSLLWPPLFATLVAFAFLNSLDNAQLATLAATLAGTSWSALSVQRSQAELVVPRIRRNRRMGTRQPGPIRYSPAPVTVPRHESGPAVHG